LQEDNELIELKAIYDSLWSDAKTLVKDMRKSVAVYQYAGMITIALAFITVTSGLPYYLQIINGLATLLTATVVGFQIAVITLEIIVGVKLLKWHSKLKKRYARLMKAEESWKK
jgi:hypothetical protein